MDKNRVSVVIICKDAELTIRKAILSAKQITDDIVVVDTGSTDGSIDEIIKFSCKFIQADWEGYGVVKNKGNEAAKADWIFSLDADEFIDEELATSIKNTDPAKNNIIYRAKRLNYLGNKPIRFGEWGNDTVTRLFNKKVASWDALPVHEQLIFSADVIKENLPGTIHHYTSPDIATYKNKMEKYAALSAEKYSAKNKKSSVVKRYLSPLFSLLQNYFFKGGFLDGKEGLEIAKAHALYNYKKYKLLKEKTTDNSI